MSILVQGQALPHFALPKTGGGLASPADYAGRQLVLFFYPKADTSACTVESVDFNGLSPAFAAANTALLGISADTLKKQENFIRKHGLAVTLLSDQTHDLIDAFGIWVEKQLYGRKYMGIERTSVLIDAKGRIVRIWSKVRVPGHALEVLAAAQALNNG